MIREARWALALAPRTNMDWAQARVLKRIWRWWKRRRKQRRRRKRKNGSGN